MKADKKFSSHRGLNREISTDSQTSDQDCVRMTLIKGCQNFFHQTNVRFHSEMATLEPQNDVIARTVRTENILLVSGRLIFQFGHGDQNNSTAKGLHDLLL